TWYHKHLGDTKLTVLVCSHNGHATLMPDYYDTHTILEPGKVKKVEYVENLLDQFLSDKEPIKFPIMIKDNIVAYFDTEGNCYKNRNIFFDEADWKKNRDNPDLHTVFTLTSRYYRDLKKRYDLQEYYRDRDLYHFVRCADLYTPP